jgi:hypothetical protein
MGKYKCEFLRVEKKYLLDELQYFTILDAIAPHMIEEKYGTSTILNIYYDTPDFRLIRASIEKPLYKEKLRLRGYGSVTDNSEVFIEIKKKLNGVVYKRRTSMVLRDAREFLNSNARKPGSEQVLCEAAWMLDSYNLVPAAAINYERAAFVGKDDPDFRLTIDRNLIGRTDSPDLIYGNIGDKFLHDGRYLMEIKTAGGMPLRMCRLLSDLRIYPTSFSKYGEYYKEYILGKDYRDSFCSLEHNREDVEKSA